MSEALRHLIILSLAFIFSAGFVILLVLLAV